MSTRIIRRTMMRVLPLTGISVAGAIALTPISGGLEAETMPADSTPTFTNAYGLTYEGYLTCSNSFVRAAHIEDGARKFLDADEGFTRHAFSAAQILNERSNLDTDDCISVSLLDINPYSQGMPIFYGLTENDVVTVSSYLSWQLPSATRPPPQRPQLPPLRFEQPAPDPNPDDRGPQMAPPIQEEAPLSEIDELVQRLIEEERAERSLAAEARHDDLLMRRLEYAGPYTIDSEFWDSVSHAIVVLPATNQGNKEYDAKTVRMTYMDRADSLITVGALEDDNSIASYSTNLGPDFVWYTAYDQGFCFPYYGTNTEIQDMAELFNRSDIYNSDTADLEHAMAGIPSCIMQGTSFVSPDIGGFMTHAVQQYPDLHEMEIIVASYLATSHNITGMSPTDFYPNSRGLGFNETAAGHGAFMPNVFFHFLSQLREFQNDESIVPSEYFRITGFAEPEVPSTTLAVDFEENGTAIRTIGEFTFILDSDFDASRGPDAFPDSIAIYSPSGTQYDLPLRYSNLNTTNQEITAGFSVSSFLGENIDGTWHIEAPPGFEMAAASLEHVYADIYFENTINRLIDYAVEWHNQNPDATATIHGDIWTQSPAIASEPQPRRRQNNGLDFDL